MFNKVWFCLLSNFRGNCGICVSLEVFVKFNVQCSMFNVQLCSTLRAGVYARSFALWYPRITFYRLWILVFDNSRILRPLMTPRPRNTVFRLRLGGCGVAPHAWPCRCPYLLTRLEIHAAETGWAEIGSTMYFFVYYIHPESVSVFFSWLCWSFVHSFLHHFAYGTLCPLFHRYALSRKLPALVQV